MMKPLPKDYKFMPTDKELVQILLNKVGGQPPRLPFGVITSCDLYGENEPWNLFNNNGTSKKQKDELYFFTNLKKRSAHRIDRTAGVGFWRGDKTAGAEIRIGKGKEKVTGLKKTYNFRLNKIGAHDAMKEWKFIMHEYSLGKDNDNVLCRIKRISRKVDCKEKRNRDELVDEECEQPRKKMCSNSNEVAWVEKEDNAIVEAATDDNASVEATSTTEETDNLDAILMAYSIEDLHGLLNTLTDTTLTKEDSYCDPDGDLDFSSMWATPPSSII